jgi:hypothetical protein
MLQNDLRQRTAGNMGFSTMLAAEYILVFISFIIYSSGLTNKSHQKNLTSTSVFQSASVPAEESQNISTAEGPGR